MYQTTLERSTSLRTENILRQGSSVVYETVHITPTRMNSCSDNAVLENQQNLNHNNIINPKPTIQKKFSNTDSPVTYKLQLS